MSSPFSLINPAIRSDAPAILERMHFSLIESQEDVPFITGDSLVSDYVPDYEVRRPYGVGLADKEIEVSIPLTSKFLLLLSWQSMPHHQVIDNKQVQEFNLNKRFMTASGGDSGSIRSRV